MQRYTLCSLYSIRGVIFFKRDPQTCVFSFFGIGNNTISYAPFSLPPSNLYNNIQRIISRTKTCSGRSRLSARPSPVIVVPLAERSSKRWPIFSQLRRDRMSEWREREKERKEEKEGIWRPFGASGAGDPWRNRRAKGKGDRTIHGWIWLRDRTEVVPLERLDI